MARRRKQTEMSDETREGRRATLADLMVQTYEFEIESPVGEVLFVEMRALSQAELLDIGRALPPFPQATQVKEYKKDENDQIKPVFDYEDPAYRKAIEERRRMEMKLAVLRSWVADLPGETEDEKLAELDNLAGWALSGLWQIVSMLITTSSEAIKHRPFRGN